MKKLINSFLEPTENIVESAYLLVRELGAKISYSTLKREIKEHPDYPTFLSISDVLNNYGIDNVTAKFDADLYPELPVPFLTQIKGDDDNFQFTVVKAIDARSIQFFDPKTQKWSITDLTLFLKGCSGILMLTEAELPIQEKNYKIKLREESRVRIGRYLIVILFPFIFFASAGLLLYKDGMNAVSPIIFSLLTLLGSLVTVILLWYEVDQENTLLQEICSTGKRTNCNAILKSKESKIFGVSWSSIGFIYFSGSFLMLLINGFSNIQVLIVLALLNAVAIPYVGYSIYYQWKIAKQWCVLCLFVQALLFSQFIVAYASNWHIVSSLVSFVSISFFLQCLCIFSIPFVLLTIILPTAKRAKQHDKVALELKRLKHNSDIFKTILQKQKSISNSVEGLGIRLGNPNGKIKLIKVCNPYCGPCAAAHAPIKELLSSNNDLEVQIIFSPPNNLNDERAYPVRHLMAINEKDHSSIENAIDDWYNAKDKNYRNFAIKYPMDDELKEQDSKLAAMQNWCQKTEIHFTPTFFINGFQLPSNYSVNDIKYFLSI